MDLKQIENILAIANDGSISRAADRLFLTQSALNQQLLKLEKELGMPLFERRSHSMIPTEAGQIYLEGAREILQIKENTYKKLNDLHQEGHGTISIAYSPERGAEMFSEVFPVFHLLYPDIRFHAKELRNKRTEQALLNKDVDLACMTYTEGQQNIHFSYIANVKEEIVLGVPASHPLAYLAGENSAERLPEIDLRRFRDTDFVLAAPETKSSDIEKEIFRTAGFQPKVLYTSSGSKTRIRSVKSQLACAFFPAFYINPDAPIVYFTVKPHIHWYSSVAYRKGSYLSVAELVLIDLIRKYNARVSNFKNIQI
ncbi:MAG TPA: LysR family transcriptional regulator [Oribacterium sp.]|nr:LysR family transcriptional regulator [Oribacterium sp.]